MAAEIRDDVSGITKSEPFHVAVLKFHMRRRNVSYRTLADRLSRRGEPITQEALRNKINRGTYSAEFFFECMTSLGVRELDLRIM